MADLDFGNSCPKCGAGDHDCDCFMLPNGDIDTYALNRAFAQRKRDTELRNYIPEPWDYSVSEDEAAHAPASAAPAETPMQAMVRGQAWLDGDDDAQPAAPRTIDDLPTQPSQGTTGQTWASEQPAAPKQAGDATCMRCGKPEAGGGMCDLCDAQLELSAMQTSRDGWSARANKAIDERDDWKDRALRNEQYAFELQRERDELRAAIHELMHATIHVGERDECVYCKNWLADERGHGWGCPWGRMVMLLTAASGQPTEDADGRTVEEQS